MNSEQKPERLRQQIHSPDHCRELARINYLLCQLPSEIIVELRSELIREYPWLLTDLSF